MAKPVNKNNDFSYLKQVSVLLVEDDELALQSTSVFLKRLIDKVFLAKNGEEGLEQWQKHKPDIVVTDIQMPVLDGLDMAARIREQNPEQVIIVITAYNEVNYLIKAIEIGIDKYIQKPLDLQQLLDAVKVTTLPKIQAHKIRHLSRQLNSSMDMILGRNNKMELVKQQVEQVAATNFSVVLQGATGVGKSFMARLLHNLSPRANGPFVTLDIGALPENLVESELFGYVSGAFTGATKPKQGFLESAAGGTLFLDDIQNMNPLVQSKLLQAIESKSFYPLGSTQPRFVDVRFVCATNKDLQEEMKSGRFRSDLFFRLQEFHIDIPSLSERVQDIPWFAKQFLLEVAEELGKAPKLTIDTPALQLLRQYPWPGNIRELKNVVRQTFLQDPENGLSPVVLKKVLGKLQTTSSQTAGEDASEVVLYASSLELTELERIAIKEALLRTENNKTQAAKLLGIGYATLKRKIKTYHLE